MGNHQTTEPDKAPHIVPGHGASVLPSVTVDSYNEEVRDADGFVGDRASRRAFRAILEEWRDRLKRHGQDPFGDTPTHDISKSKLDKVLVGDDPIAAGLVHTVVEEFACELASVIRRFLQLDSWRGTERIVIGGGMIASRIGERAMGRVAIMLAAEGIDVELTTIANHPDKAGLIGSVHLAPSWVLDGHDAILAFDIGGTNLRAGIVELKIKKEAMQADVWKFKHWRHADEKPSRDELIARLVDLGSELTSAAGDAKLKLAPFVGVGCPGRIDEHGMIITGAQNLPGDWEGNGFNLTNEVARKLPRIGNHEPVVVLHNDAVVQGLSEIPNMRSVSRWGVLTIGTGLGNARFTNRVDQ